MFKRILVSIDLAEPGLTQGALARAKELAGAGDASLRLIHVRPGLIDAVSRYLPAGFEEKDASDTRNKLEEAAKAAGIEPSRFSTATPSGGVYDTILEEAKAFGADLIIVGSRRPALARYLLGSNAERIVRHAECSVLVVR